MKKSRRTFVAVLAGLLGGSMAHAASSLETLLIEDFKPFVKTLSREVSLFHWAKKDLMKKISRGDGARYAKSLAERFAKDPVDGGGMVGPGLYTAIDPIATQSYGDSLLWLEMKKGTRFLAWNEFQSEVLRVETRKALKDASCSDSHLLTAPSCRKILTAVFKALQVEGIMYTYNSEQLTFCAPGRKRIAINLVGAGGVARAAMLFRDGINGADPVYLKRLVEFARRSEHGLSGWNIPESLKDPGFVAWAKSNVFVCLSPSPYAEERMSSMDWASLRESFAKSVPSPDWKRILRYRYFQIRELSKELPALLASGRKLEAADFDSLKETFHPRTDQSLPRYQYETGIDVSDDYLKGLESIKLTEDDGQLLEFKFVPDEEDLFSLTRSALEDSPACQDLFKRAQVAVARNEDWKTVLEQFDSRTGRLKKVVSSTEDLWDCARPSNDSSVVAYAKLPEPGVAREYFQRLLREVSQVDGAPAGFASLVRSRLIELPDLMSILRPFEKQSGAVGEVLRATALIRFGLPPIKLERLNNPKAIDKFDPGNLNESALLENASKSIQAVIQCERAVARLGRGHPWIKSDPYCSED